jgi:hypothetical protein
MAQQPHVHALNPQQTAQQQLGIASPPSSTSIGVTASAMQMPEGSTIENPIVDYRVESAVPHGIIVDFF